MGCRDGAEEGAAEGEEEDGGCEGGETAGEEVGGEGGEGGLDAEVGGWGFRGEGDGGEEGEAGGVDVVHEPGGWVGEEWRAREDGVERSGVVERSEVAGEGGVVLVVEGADVGVQEDESAGGKKDADEREVLQGEGAPAEVVWACGVPGEKGAPAGEQGRGGCEAELLGVGVVFQRQQQEIDGEQHCVGQHGEPARRTSGVGSSASTPEAVAVWHQTTQHKTEHLMCHARGEAGEQRRPAGCEAAEADGAGAVGEDARKGARQRVQADLDARDQRRGGVLERVEGEGGRAQSVAVVVFGTQHAVVLEAADHGVLALDGVVALDDADEGEDGVGGVAHGGAAGFGGGVGGAAFRVVLLLLLLLSLLLLFRVFGGLVGGLVVGDPRSGRIFDLVEDVFIIVVLCVARFALKGTSAQRQSGQVLRTPHYEVEMSSLAG